MNMIEHKNAIDRKITVSAQVNTAAGAVWSENVEMRLITNEYNKDLNCAISGPVFTF